MESALSLNYQTGKLTRFHGCGRRSGRDGGTAVWEAKDSSHLFRKADEKFKLAQ